MRVYVYVCSVRLCVRVVCVCVCVYVHTHVCYLCPYHTGCSCAIVRLHVTMLQPPNETATVVHQTRKRHGFEHHNNQV